MFYSIQTTRTAFWRSRLKDRELFASEFDRRARTGFRQNVLSSTIEVAFFHKTQVAIIHSTFESSRNLPLVERF